MHGTLLKLRQTSPDNFGININDAGTAKGLGAIREMRVNAEELLALGEKRRHYGEVRERFNVRRVLS
jgi:hypothetical protein